METNISKILQQLSTTLLMIVFFQTSYSEASFQSFIEMRDGYFYNPSEDLSWVPLGIAYQTWNRPLGVWQSFDQLDYDLDEMVKMGANCIRVDFVWQHIEEKGDNLFSWDNYDYLIRACRQRGLRLIPLIGYQWPPRWFPDNLYTKHPPSYDGEGIFHSERWQSDIMSFEHPDARQQYVEYIRAVCGRYRDEKTIVAWVLGNEYGYLGLWSLLLDGYDDYSEAAFRKWAKKKYKTVDAMNIAWGTDYTHFEPFEENNLSGNLKEIRILSLMKEFKQFGPAGAQWADMIQWREDSVAEFVSLGVKAAREVDQNHLLTYSTVGMQWGEEDWRYHAEDRGKITAACERIGAPLDFFSVNNYPWAILGHESQNGHWGISFTKAVTGLPVMYSETGFTSSETLWPGMNEQKQGELARNSLIEGLIAGAVGVHLFTWQDRPYITDREKGFGIVSSDRRVKQSFWAIRDTYNALEQADISRLLAGSRDPEPDVAFLWTSANDSQYNRYEAEMQQIAGALERLGYEPGFIDIHDLASGAFSNFRVLFLPRNMRVEEIVPGTDKGVMEFIRTEVIPTGIHVVAGADLPGMQNQNGIEITTFEREIDAIFGVDASYRDGYETPQRWGEATFRHWRQIKVEFTDDFLDHYSYCPKTWKYNSALGITDGSILATMDILVNSGFEDSITNIAPWNISDSNSRVEIIVDSGLQLEGNNMLQISGAVEMKAPVFEAVPGRRYEVSAFFRTNGDRPFNNNQQAYIELRWLNYDQHQSLGVKRSEILTANASSVDWQRFTAVGVAPDDVYFGQCVIKMIGQGSGILYVDNFQQSPALIVKDHGTAKAALFAFAPGDLSPDGDSDDNKLPDILPWKWRYDIFGALVRDYFGVAPKFEVLGENAHLCLAEYRILADGSTLWQIKNYSDGDLKVQDDNAKYSENFRRFPERESDLSNQTFTIRSMLFSGKTVEALIEGRILRKISDDSISIDLSPNGTEILHVYSSSEEKAVIRIADFPATVRGGESRQVVVKFDPSTSNATVINLVFFGIDNAGREVIRKAYPEEMKDEGYQSCWIWIPEPDLGNPEFTSDPNLVKYYIQAYLEDSKGNKITESIPAETRLEWGVNPITLPSHVTTGQTVLIEYEWENLPEQLAWQTTPIRRNEVFPGRIALFRSTKTEQQFPGHYKRINQVADWLESMGYSSGNPLKISFDNVEVIGQFRETFEDAANVVWSREAGAANWMIENGALRVSRIGNDDNIVLLGNSEYEDFTIQADIIYDEPGPYFNAAELYCRYIDRDNFYKVGIYNFYGSWRIKATARVEGRNESEQWLYTFSKDDKPQVGECMHLKVDVTGEIFVVSFNGKVLGGASENDPCFSDGNLKAGRIGLGTQAAQLGIWEPQRGYYFIDDDEYPPASREPGETPRLLELDWGYLREFFSTLILPSTFIMSDTEISNIRYWLCCGSNSLIVTNGGAGKIDQFGMFKPDRIVDLLGVTSNLTEQGGFGIMKIGGEEHYITRDYPLEVEFPVSVGNSAYREISSGSALGRMTSETETIPAIIINQPIDSNPDAPAKVVTFNFAIDQDDQLMESLGLVAKRLFEWARNQAYRMRIELKYDQGLATNDYDLTFLTIDEWITRGSGETSLALDIPAKMMTGTEYYWVLYPYVWDSDDAWNARCGYYTSLDDSPQTHVYVIGKHGPMFPVYTDWGLPASGADIYVWPDNDYSTMLDAKYTGTTAPEGNETCRMTTSAYKGYGGWGVFSIYPDDNQPKLMDMTDFAGGHISFYAKSDRTLENSIKIEIEGPRGFKSVPIRLDSVNTEWQVYKIPISSFKNIDLRNIFGLFLITYEGSRTECYVDDVWWLGFSREITP